MERGKPEVRLFTGADAAMRSRLRTMHGHYLTDAAAFAAVNPALGGAFEAQWLAAIEAADQAPNVDVRRGELRENTATVEETMEAARRAAQAVFYFVEQAFPKNKGRLSQYGKDRYRKASTDPEEMRLLLDMAAQAAERDHAELAATGYGAPQLSSLKTLAARLDTVDTAHEMRKGSNQEGTDAYVKAQNAAFSYAQQLNKAAKLVFGSNPVRRQLYRLTDAETEAATRPAKPKANAPAVPS